MNEKADKRDSIVGLVSKALSKLKSKQQVAQELRNSGKLNALRLEEIKNGANPWKILRYRHIIEPSETPLVLPYNSYTTPKVFEEHLRYIAFDCNPLPMAELVRLIHFNEPIPERAVALTFDCGHSDFFLNAFPLLLKYEIPATVCLPTAYINCDSFFINDRVRIALIALQKIKLPLPEFKFLDPKLYEVLKKSSPVLEINDLLINYFVEFISTCDEASRVHLLSVLAQELSTCVELPTYEDFLRWEDIQLMSEKGVTFASMGHGHIYPLAVTKADFIRDVQQSLEVFMARELPLEKYFCLVEGGFSKDVLQALADIKYLYALSLGESPPLAKQTTLTKTLPRVLISEETAPTIDIFACRTWQVKSDGFVY